MTFLGRVVRFLPTAARLAPTATLTQTRYIARWVSPTLKELFRREQKLGGKKRSPRNQHLEWNLEAELYAFGRRLNEEFDAELLLQAFTDRSYVIAEEARQKEIGFNVQLKDNRELAQEGEKFMKEYVQLYLEAVLPRLPLAGVSAVRQHLLSEAVLAHVSLHLGTKDIILTPEVPPENVTLASTFKAVVGALLQSSGEERTAHFVRDFLVTQLQGRDVNECWRIEDPWGMLAGILRGDGAEVEPRLIGEVGGNTLLACYRVGLYVEKRMISSGFGESVAIAKEMAAREALKKIFGTQENMPPIDFQLQGIPKQSSEKRYQISSS